MVLGFMGPILELVEQIFGLIGLIFGLVGMIFGLVELILDIRPILGLLVLMCSLLGLA